jgi:uncharacterized membrane protein YphA (DoxX/SURF4 family)
LFLVLLRIAIGWHFLYEGTQKILSTPSGKATILARIFPTPEGPPFSSEGYLRNSTGPLAPRFRALVPDVDSRQKLDPDALKESWSTERTRIANHYGFDADQLNKAEAILAEHRKQADEWFQSVENRQKVKKYLDEVAEIEAIENNPYALSYERSNARDERKVAEADRRELVKEVDAWTNSLHEGVLKLATPDQIRDRGPYGPPLNQLEKVDLLTMWGLSAVGLCLMLGLFTPLAALGGAAYLLGFYLSMPPWPGLPEGMTEGHYRYVNKNLIEMLACLVLASTPNGLWIGLDALLFGWIGRGRRRAEAEAETPRAVRPEPQDRRKFKNR